MKKIFSITCLIALLCLVGSCSIFDRTVQIKDVSKPEQITISKAPLQGNVYLISIQVTGQLDGTASLTIDGRTSVSDKMHNNVNFKWENDWYSDVAVIHQPIDVKSGKLTISYRFFG
ncbi:hypothetical protein [Brasilonema octagenarum]|uniref:Lipoprotein n=1 Tax=Brasilonema octagenarum UFV-OR1 TaxID=417115 RepID=A0ABX1LZH3_9CYAN|nr:hypothetical protein [Brasilonema octagenarum]NMF61594.1 hypothetical protein [Brasilonema octagenarum UFV-OR1]